MTRIAFVTNFLPAPANSGAVIRANRLARALSGIGDLWLYARASETDAQRYAANGDLAIFGRVRLHTEPPDLHAKLSRVFTPESMEALDVAERSARGPCWRRIIAVIRSMWWSVSSFSPPTLPGYFPTWRWFSTNTTLRATLLAQPCRFTPKGGFRLTLGAPRRLWRNTRAGCGRVLPHHLSDD